MTLFLVFLCSELFSYSIHCSALREDSTVGMQITYRHRVRLVYCHVSSSFYSSVQWLFLVPIKGGIGSI